MSFRPGFKKGKDNPRARGLGGRKKGVPNKATAVQAELEAAFQRCGSPEDWDAIAQESITQAKGGNMDPLSKLLPYVAKKKDNILEANENDGDGKILSVTLKLSE